MSGGLMSGGLMSGGRMSGGRLSGGLKSYDPSSRVTATANETTMAVRVISSDDENLTMEDRDRNVDRETSAAQISHCDVACIQAGKYGQEQRRAWERCPTALCT